MRTIVAVTLAVIVALTGCATLGLGKADFATRIMAGLTCIAAVASAGGVVVADPELGFATATDVLNAITKIATSAGVATAMAACKETMALVGQDVQGALDMVTAKAEAPAEPPAQRKARLTRTVPKQAAPDPIQVQVPLR